MMTDANQIYCNDHFVIHTNIKSLHFIPETNICQLQKKKTQKTDKPIKKLGKRCEQTSKKICRQQTMT